MWRLLILLTTLSAYAQAQPFFESPDPGLRMNQIQVIGTHNSYHVNPGPAQLALYKAVTPEAAAWDYTHPPLDEQLSCGVRSFELDLYWRNGTWAVFHVPILDARSSCPTLEECLSTVRAWSVANPGHVPISFLLEIKVDGIAQGSRMAAPSAAALDHLDDIIRGIFPRDALITPDQVRGDAATLEEAVTTRGWPLLEDVRGTVMFVLHERGFNRDLYTLGRPNLEGRPMFVRAEPGQPFAATMVMDHPKPEDIAPLVRAGYYIRTRGDANLRYSTERRQAALESGAQIVTTDFPNGSPSKTSGYTLAFANGAPARVNPVNAAR